MRESSIESGCCAYAKRHRVPTFKLYGGIAGDPDRAFLLPGQRVWLVEFKTATGALSPRQHVRHAELARAGHPVSVVRSVKMFRELLDVYLQATA